MIFLCPCETPEEDADCLNRLEKSLDIAQSRLTASEHSELVIKRYNLVCRHIVASFEL